MTQMGASKYLDSVMDILEKTSFPYECAKYEAELVTKYVVIHAAFGWQNGIRHEYIALMMANNLHKFFGSALN